MRIAISLLSLAVLATATPFAQPNNGYGRPKCCDAKCYKRAEYADKHDLGDFSKDCKSYLKTTVTPCPTTATATTYTTTTVTVTTTLGSYSGPKVANRGLEERTAPKCTPKASVNDQPWYANGYCNSGQFSSACSCLGVKPTTVTAPRQTVTTTKVGGTSTVTVTVTKTTTTSSLVCDVTVTTTLVGPGSTVTVTEPVVITVSSLVLRKRQLSTTPAAPSTTPRAPSTTPAAPSTPPRAPSTTPAAPSTTPRAPSTTADTRITCTATVTSPLPLSTVTVTSFSTVTRFFTTTTSTTTPSTTPSTTTSSAAPVVTACTDAQASFCGDNCFCNIGVGNGDLECSDTDACPGEASDSNPACSTDADCVSIFGAGYRCGYDTFGVCPGGRVCGRTPGSCPSNASKRDLAARELALVFKQVAGGTLITRA